MRALLPLVLATALLSAGAASAAPPSLPVPAAAAPGLRAGVGVVDATWHVGASAGQYASTQDASDPLRSEWDPDLQHVKNAASYGVASRLSIRALVLQSPGGAPVALVKDDNYLSQDMLVRRAAQILAADGSAVTYDHLLVSATHDHSSPYYSTPAAGVWLFQDVFDLRMFEYQARRIAEAVETGERGLRPARLGATTVQVPEYHGNIAGAGVAEDGSPVGYPLGENDHGLVVVRVDDVSAPGRPRPLASYVNYAEHGESLDGYDLLSGDWVAPFQRYVDRATGAPVVVSQGAVGSAEGPYEHAFAKGAVPTVDVGGEPVPAVWAHVGFAQAERGARLLADRVIEAWTALGQGRGGQVPMSTDVPVAMLTHYVAGPASHPYPSVSNCRTERTVDGDPGAPVVGLPDCERASGAFGQTLPTPALFASLRGAGVPVPATYDAPAAGAVEEDARLKLQAVRIGDVLLASCACEPQSDLVKQLETRTDDVVGNRYDGFDVADAAAVRDAWPQADPPVAPCRASGSGQNCPDPRDSTGARRLQVPQAAFARMEAQIHNPADGWDDPAAAATAGSEPADPAAIKGNVTGHELTTCGYRLPVAVGHTGDYNGYTVSYREFLARDSYRKALTAYGPHTADHMITHLMSLASALRCGTPVPAEPGDVAVAALEQRQAGEAVALGRLSSAAYDGWTAQTPDDAGPVAALEQPTDVERFDAAAFRWVGGDSWTDQPVVAVERRDERGAWQPYADQSGEVQTVLDQPAGVAASAVDHRTGAQRWTWRASFEAFDAYPRAAVDGGQVPAGTYRFSVRGASHTGGAVVPYTLTSQPFRVGRWTGLRAHDVLAGPDGSVSFRTDPVVYPRTYRSAIRFVADDLGGVDAGPGDTNDSLLCRTCTFRPWARTGRVVAASVAVLGAGGHVVRTVPAVRTGADTWTVDAHLTPSERAVVPVGGLRDTYGETNGIGAS